MEESEGALGDIQVEPKDENVGTKAAVSKDDKCTICLELVSGGACMLVSWQPNIDSIFSIC